jgi:hypothetical protein
MNAIFTSARYSTILLSFTFAVQCCTSTPVIFLMVRAAALTAFSVASSQLLGELPINSTTFATDG